MYVTVDRVQFDWLCSMALSSQISSSATTSSCLSLYSSSSSGTLNASGLEVADLDPPPPTKRARGEFFCLCYRCLLLMSLVNLLHGVSEQRLAILAGHISNCR